jgi:3,4-dihydroxy-2-butanone 4-phosphate synthase
MSKTSVELGVNALRDGDLVIVFDDVKTQMASLVGTAETVSAEKVNMMTKLGQGLVYVCITEEQAQKLKLPYMVEHNNSQMKPFTISVDYITTTTGISTFERADTIKAFTNDLVQLEHFRTPGHIFPLVSQNKGLLQRVDIVEASVDLALMSSSTPAAYICEILNASGDVASFREVKRMAEAHNIRFIKLSDILAYTKNELLCSFSGLVLRGNQSNRKIGFPTVNLQMDSDVQLVKGVYGVNVMIDNAKYIGVMNVGTRCEVHIFDFNKMIYDAILKIDVLFFVRDEMSFATLNDLIVQIGKDIENVENCCSLQKVN